MKCFELFSGIGGMHFSFIESGMPVDIVRALDINTTANKVYTYNFPQSMLMENNVQMLTAKMLNELDIEVLSMSPPCQPFTRLGLQKGNEDNRCDALHHILQLLPSLTSVQYIILENVVGFETSATRNDVIEVLQQSNFKYQEFIINPTQLFIPNARNRYYLLAKKDHLHFAFKEVNGIQYSIPIINDSETLRLIEKYRRNDSECFSIEEIVDLNESNGKCLPDKVLSKYADILDIVIKDSKRSCCFTKAYSHYIEGTGSVFCPLTKEDIDRVYNEMKNFEKGGEQYLELLRSLSMRFFSPEEVSKLMCFPNEFKFPKDLSGKQKYRLLGNSINVHVVAVLIRLLLLS